ncbi:hypothetical protein SARC_13726 [Sphaeroforma arctica JP610]|uniref:Uncharacterized protein n=1 Tax=Sphaeroforma arctica JP610 TaxID=667725 RepID=A0A0L0FCB2_9EUKA|nr:hypothetical protein SARC_13726 [Sphaeroforma arctica JP610]KNC73718.1 hypothetical protein SARC_13726 [Sphaeroforma arctica JP610]|eukprot:XP_014147620.1 hypothetical protein SARC_13726 [Sphaeroforma arctica JP610]
MSVAGICSWASLPLSQSSKRVLLVRRKVHTTHLFTKLRGNFGHYLKNDTARMASSARVHLNTPESPIRTDLHRYYTHYTPIARGKCPAQPRCMQIDRRMSPYSTITTPPDKNISDTSGANKTASQQSNDRVTHPKEILKENADQHTLHTTSNAIDEPHPLYAEFTPAYSRQPKSYPDYEGPLRSFPKEPPVRVPANLTRKVENCDKLYNPGPIHHVGRESSVRGVR